MGICYQRVNRIKKSRPSQLADDDIKADGDRPIAPRARSLGIWGAANLQHTGLYVFTLNFVRARQCRMTILFRVVQQRLVLEPPSLQCSDFSLRFIL